MKARACEVNAAQPLYVSTKCSGSIYAQVCKQCVFVGSQPHLENTDKVILGSKHQYQTYHDLLADWNSRVN